jgi:opacity protein-like surface antigen
MNRLQRVIVVAVALVLVAASGAAARSTHRHLAGTVHTLQASSYTSNGDLIRGWNWLRAPGNTASWTFDASGIQTAKHGSVFLNLNPLATRGVSGGSGWSGSLSLTLAGNKTKKAVIFANNPFQPRSSTDSGGVGYQAYGAVAIPSSVYRGATTITITAVRSKTSVVRDIHLASNKDAAVIAYLTS